MADDATLRLYGPVLRRLTIGLLDEVSDLTLLCLDESLWTRHVPCPPVRVITQTRRYPIPAARFDINERQAWIMAPPFRQLDWFCPRRSLARIANALALYKPLLLHALSDRHFPLARNLSKKLGIPYVVSVLSFEPGDSIFSDLGCGGLLCCSSGQMRRIRNRRAFPPGRVRLLPLGTHVTDEPSCFKQDAPLSNIFCCCPLEHGSGLSDILEAVKKLTGRGHQLRLFISGQGSAEHELRREAAKMNLLAQVHFIPPVENVLSTGDAYKVLFRETDIFIQPRSPAQWQPELLEAMSVGNAVISVRCPNNDLIVHGKTALTVPFRDKTALADALERLLQNHDSARTLAQAAQQHLRRHFLAGHMIARLVKAYRKALSS